MKIRLLAVVLVLALALGGGWLWLRHSSLLAGKRPHRTRITAVDQRPVAVLTAGSAHVTVAGDGTLLRDAPRPDSLPSVAVRSIPAGPHVTDQNTLAIIAVLAAAPYGLLAHAQSASENSAHGVVVDLRAGPSLYFGDPGLERPKWAAAAAVLGDQGSAGASYIDVTDPRRPAAGVQ